MKTIIILKLILIFFFNISLSWENQESLFDFSGMEHFFYITSILKEDREPSDNDWNKLFETPGYNVLLKGEFSREFFIENFRIVFMPSKSEELDQKLKKEKDAPFHIQYIHHYLKAKQKEPELKKFINKLKVNSFDILENASKKAEELLPTIKKDEYIPVSFLIFANDARGYNPLVIDTLFSIELGESLVLLIGHELHHYYRNKILDYDRSDIQNEDKDLIWVLDQIHCEGIADQIDKRKLILCKDGPLHFFAAQWNKLVQQAPEYINEMDRLLCKIADSPQMKKEIALELRTKLPMSGHPIGFYMTNIIIDKLGTDQLIEETGNPFAFFRLYNKAAGLDSGLPLFSKKALNIIKKLEDRYIRESQANPED